MKTTEKYKLYNELYDRAKKMGKADMDKTSHIMDIESADKKFNLRLEEWLNADDFNFIHDWYGIQDNILRDTFPATDFGLFIPRFAGKAA